MGGGLLPSRNQFMADKIQIADLDDLIKAAAVANKHFGEGFCWWRGEGVIDDTWKLKPKIYRGEQNEASLAFHFINRAKVRCNNWPAGSDEWPSWLFLMQHYGLPTRLLDWSESPLIALYFAVKEAAYQGENERIWCLQPYKLNLLYNVNGIALPQMDDAKFLCQDAFFKDQSPSAKILSVTGDHFDVRHLVQSAAFTIHGITIALNEHQKRDQFLLEFEVSGKMKSNLLDALKVVGIRESYIFPDLDHLALDLGILTDNV
jgi:hypothetical protein